MASAMHSVTHKIQRFSLRIFLFSSVLSCPQLAGVDLSHKQGHYELSALMPVLRSHCLEHPGSQDREASSCPVPSIPGPHIPLSLDSVPWKQLGVQILFVACVLPGTQITASPTEPYKFSKFLVFFLPTSVDDFLLLWG